MPPPRTRTSRCAPSASSLSILSASATVSDVSIAARAGVSSPSRRNASNSSRSLLFGAAGSAVELSERPAIPLTRSPKAGKTTQKKVNQIHHTFVNAKSKTPARTTGTMTTSEVVSCAFGLILPASSPKKSSSDRARGLCPRRGSNSCSGLLSTARSPHKYTSTGRTKPCAMNVMGLNANLSESRMKDERHEHRQACPGFKGSPSKGAGGVLADALGLGARRRRKKLPQVRRVGSGQTGRGRGGGPTHGDGRASGCLRGGGRSRRQNTPLLRPLRRAAARPSGVVGERPVRAEGEERCPLRPWRGRRQGRRDGPHTGPENIPKGARPPALQAEVSHRGRGRGWKSQPTSLRPPKRGAIGRRRLSLGGLDEGRVGAAHDLLRHQGALVRRAARERRLTRPAQHVRWPRAEPGLATGASVAHHKGRKRGDHARQPRRANRASLQGGPRSDRGDPL